MIKKNLWVIEYVPNQNSQKILDYLKWSPYQTLDELVNIPSKDSVKLLGEYERYLRINYYKPSTIEAKIKALYYFYYTNGLKIVNVYSD